MAESATTDPLSITDNQKSNDNQASLVVKTSKWPKSLLRLDFHFLLLIVILVIGLALRLHHLDNQSLWLDEIDEATTAQTPFPAFFNAVRFDAGAAPFDYLANKLVIGLFGSSTLSVRLWAFSCGGMAIVMMYLVGKLLFNSHLLGLIAAGLLTFAPFHINYSQEARFYALAVLSALLSLYFFYLAYTKRSWQRWLIYSVSVTLVFYTHYFVALLLPLEGLFLALSWFGRPLLDLVTLKKPNYTRWRNGLEQTGLCLLAMLGGVALFTPWLFYGILNELRDNGYPRLADLDFSQVGRSLSIMLAGSAEAPLVPLLIWLVLGLALVGTVMAFGLKRGIVGVIVLAVVLAMPLAWITDQNNHYFWNERQIIFTLPLLYLLVAAGLVLPIKALLQLKPVATFLKKITTTPKAKYYYLARLVYLGIVVSGIAALNWGGIHLVYGNQFFMKEDWRGVSAYLSANFATTDLFYSSMGAHYSYGIAYYAPALLSHTSEWCQEAPPPTTPDSVLVMFTDSAYQSCSAERWHTYLAQQGWGYKDFAGLRLYSPHLKLVNSQKVINLPAQVELSKTDVAAGHFYQKLQLFSGQQYNLRFTHDLNLKPNQLVVQFEFRDQDGKLLHLYPPYQRIDVATFQAGPLPDPHLFEVDFLVPPDTATTWIILSNYTDDSTSHFGNLFLRQEQFDYKK
jgi:uncharacterized membrane protein